VRFAAHTIGWTAIGFALCIALAVIAPRAVGGQSYTVMSGSMRPAIDTGDVVVNKRISPLEARPGDVLTFRDPSDANRLVTHRLRSAAIRNGTAQMVTKGDANNTVERWSVQANGSIGRVTYRVPRLGYVLAWGGGRTGKLLLIAVPALLLAMWELLRIWRPERKEGAHEASA
jgi:signal peptidase I